MSDCPQLELRNQLCHRLYSASNAIVRTYRNLLRPLDLTYPQYVVMMSLWENSGVCVKDIAAQTFLDSGTLTPILKRLETKGYIRRDRCEDDERQKTIRLTEAGKALREKARSIPEQMFCFTGLREPEASQLIQLLDQLHISLTQAGVVDEE